MNRREREWLIRKLVRVEKQPNGLYAVVDGYERRHSGLKRVVYEHELRGCADSVRATRVADWMNNEIGWDDAETEKADMDLWNAML